MQKIKKIPFACIFMAFMTIWYWSRIMKTVEVCTSSKPILLHRLIAKSQATTDFEGLHLDVKFILQWTKSYTEPFKFMGTGQETFVKRRCTVNNCYITSNRRLLNSLKHFDAVLFHGPELSSSLIRLPGRRSPKQKYVFVSMESSRNYPARYDDIYDEFFNWTWTYKLNSDIYFGYIIIRNKQGDVIGPKEVMHWPKIEDMQPIDNNIRERLKSKRIAAAWFVSECYTLSKRYEVGKYLQKELAKYNMTVDVYGECGNKLCPKNQMGKCLRMLETDYYFYLSFENSITVDYVTEKILHALQHYTVPIVYGGANYTRFMPEGSYLNVQNQNMADLAKKMADIINHKEKYYDYFRWTNHYSYHYVEESPETDYYCEFCKKINDPSLVNRTSYVKYFKNWWNPKSKIKK